MPRRRWIITLLLACPTLTLGQDIRPEFKARGLAGNPVFPGWYADPEAIIFGDEYWIFPTLSDNYGGSPSGPRALTEKQKLAINPQYLKQTYLDAFSSPDLVTWTKHPRVLDVADIGWAEYALWAPSTLAANDKYYLLFGANDIQSDSEEGGIGVAVADTPAGPYKDAIGRPLIDRFHNGAQPIDQFAFRDDDGQTFKEITPENYVEGPFVFKRGGRYYLMWSEGGWGGPDYSVAYAIGESPTGPFTRIAKILKEDPGVATGAGHHSVLHPPGSDDWYIVYHRRPLGDRDGNHREVCIDRMEFNEDGTIKPVKITFEGVKRRPLK